MKAYPLIYSRTKNFDFVPDFLVRPNDLEYAEALKYVLDAMFELDFVDRIRYTAFSTDRYCICGGIACISKKLFEIVSQSGKLKFPMEMHEPVEHYLNDCKGRKVACYIGIAIPKSEVQKGVIPNVSLEHYWNIYLQYLMHQWDSVTETSSEKLELPPLEIPEQRCDNIECLSFKEIGGHKVIRQSEFSAAETRILNYVFDQIMSGQKDSIITGVTKLSFWNKTRFKTTVVSDQLFPLLKPVPQANQSTLLQTPAEKQEDFQIKHTPQPRIPTGEKKTNPIPEGHSGSKSYLKVVAVIVLIVIILLILKSCH